MTTKSETVTKSREQGEEKLEAGKTYGMTVNLPRVPPSMEARIEEVISEFEKEHEEDVFNGRNGEIPRVNWKDYALEAAVGVILVAYLFIALS